MKNLYSLIFAIFMILPALHVSGKEVNQKKALEVATQFMNSRSVLRSGTSLKLALTGKSENANLRSSENPSYYVYNVEGGKGFVIIAGDDAVAPILGYSFNSSFEVEGMPNNLKSFLNHYDTQIRKAAELGLETSSAWNNLRNEVAENSVVLETAKWDQGKPYNGECPMVVNSKGETVRAYTGCPSTAVGIVMAYHKYPSNLVGGEISYTRELEDFVAKDGNTYNNTQEVSINLDRPYNWDLMLNDYQTEYTEAQGKEVAALMARLGAAMLTRYDADMSGSTMLEVFKAMISNFQYPSSKMYYRSSMVEDDFRSLLINDIDNNLPILYSSTTGGHIFVCDGYDDNGNFHFNWGWGGLANGFYALDALKPTYTGIGAGDLGDYTEGIVVISNIKPRSEEKASDIYMYSNTYNEPIGVDANLGGLCLEDESEVIVAGTPFSVSLNAVVSMYGLKDTVTFGIAHIDQDGQIKDIIGQSKTHESGVSFYEMEELFQSILASVQGPEELQFYFEQHPEIVALLQASIMFESIECTIEQPIEEGDRLIAVSKANGNEEWYPIYSLAEEEEEEGEEEEGEESEGTEGDEEGEGDEEEGVVIELLPYFIDLTAEATANEKVTTVPSQSICVNGNVVVLQTEQPLKASVYSITGALVKQQTVSGTAQVTLPKGIYIVQLGNKAYKVVIKK
jgi:hypothetical protein